jgi:hypothetical protein
VATTEIVKDVDGGPYRWVRLRPPLKLRMVSELITLMVSPLGGDARAQEQPPPCVVDVNGRPHGR